MYLGVLFGIALPYEKNAFFNFISVNRLNILIHSFTSPYLNQQQEHSPFLLLLVV